MERLYVLCQVKERKLTQVEAGRQLKLSERQIIRLLKRLGSNDYSSLKSRHRGGNRAFNDDFKQRVLEIVKEKYHGPVETSHPPSK
ncbi:hypothetical protein AGMMS49949_07820 [Alphaproteobacteria bacterium]|nr:hypothetical protein AGMMS49949_07820 [Alphaproteobacteria bacterium]